MIEFITRYVVAHQVPAVISEPQFPGFGMESQTDTVTDTTTETLANKTATGFAFKDATAPALWGAIQRALEHYPDTACWQQIMTTGMKLDFSWKHSAEEYLALYEQLLAAPEAKESNIG